MKNKLMSRKFWLSVSAFLGSIGAGIAGIVTDNNTITTVGIVCAILSSAIYSACEAYIDGKAVVKKEQKEIITEEKQYAN